MEKFNPGSFQRALDRFKESLSPALIDQFSVCSLQDIRDVAGDIQREQGQGGRLRYLRRLGTFIEAMNQLSKTIEVFLNVNELVCFIWGPVKFVLLAAKTHVESLDKILDAYARVGEEIPSLYHYRATFERHPTLANVLEDYYSDILSFHQAVLSIFNRPKWKQLCHSIWKTFDSDLQPILNSMNSRRTLLESEKSSATLDGIQLLLDRISQDREKQARDIRQINKQSHARRVSEFRDKLQTADYQTDYEISTQDRTGDSGKWIFNNNKFQTWHDKSLPNHGILYVNGKPGAGKTTLTSGIIEKLLDNRDYSITHHCVLYFYFKHQDPGKSSFNGLLRAMLEQLINQDPCMSDHLFEKASSTQGVTLRTTNTLKKLIEDSLESYHLCYIVLDGLDECTRDEAVNVVNWLISLTSGKSDNSATKMRVLFSGQRDGVLDNLLASQPSIELEMSDHITDIRQYCLKLCGIIQRKFDLEPGKAHAIAEKIVAESDGMFLYARVVLENLRDQTSRYRLEQELNENTLPLGADKIEKAYERVAVRVFEHVSKAELEDATKILGWVICGRRHMRWREIQAFFCIDPLMCDVDYDGKRLRVTCKDLCRSFVDIHQAGAKVGHPEDLIKIVHSTAQEFLVRRGLVNRSLENAKIALFCVQYLTSEPFRSEMEEEIVQSHAEKGYYSLQDYAVQNCFGHLQECVTSQEDLQPEQFTRLMVSAELFLSSYLAQDTGRPTELRGSAHTAEILRGLPQEPSERFGQYNLELRTSFIRRAIQKLCESPPTVSWQHPLRGLHGVTGPFKCPKPWCKSFCAGFDTQDLRRQHVNRHELPFRCSFQHCWANRLGFDAESKLERHRINCHGETQEVKLFPLLGRVKGVTIWALVLQGNLAGVKALIDRGHDVNERNPKDESTPLYCAATAGNFQICKYLLDSGADLNLPGTPEGRTVLHVAIISGEVDIVHLLLQHKDCLPDKADSYSRTAFCYGCALGQLNVVRLLLETQRIDPAVRATVTPEKCTTLCRLMPPIAYACIEGHFTVVHHLIEHGQMKFLDEKVLTVALELGRSHVISFLLLLGLEVKSCRPVLKALRKGRASMAKSVLGHMLSNKSFVGSSDKDFEACIQLSKSRGWDEVTNLLKSIEIS